MDFILIKKNVKNISIKIKNEDVFVVSPKNINIEYVNKFLLKKINWIEKAKNFYRAKKNFFDKNNNLKFLDNETIFFLGKNYKILLIISNKNLIELKDNFIVFFVKNKNNTYTYKKNLFRKWLLNNSIIIFENLMMEVYIKFFLENIKNLPKLKIRKMISTWGICNYKKNIITLNLELIKCNKKIISYILIHEFTHFLCQNHSKKFYNFVKKFVPDYKNYEYKLKCFDVVF